MSRLNRRPALCSASRYLMQSPVVRQCGPGLPQLEQDAAKIAPCSNESYVLIVCVHKVCVFDSNTGAE